MHPTLRAVTGLSLGVRGAWAPPGVRSADGPKKRDGGGGRLRWLAQKCPRTLTPNQTPGRSHPNDGGCRCEFGDKFGRLRPKCCRNRNNVDPRRAKLGRTCSTSAQFRPKHARNAPSSSQIWPMSVDFAPNIGCIQGGPSSKGIAIGCRS